MRCIFRHDATHLYEYGAHQRTLTAWQPSEVGALLDEVTQLCEAQRWYAVGFISYCAAPAFDAALDVRTAQSLPLAAFHLFAQRRPFHPNNEGYVQDYPWALQQSREAFAKGIDAIRQQILAGDLYQVNFTSRCHSSDFDMWTTWQQWAVDARYAAWIEAQDYVIASASPELFFSKQGNHVVSQPMKGTASTGDSEEAAQQAREWLAASEKNRAENLMITDMVRNDLGRIAEPGSVRVEDLFKIERHGTVWQMISSVHCQTQASLSELMAATFPPASITGAPKRAAMQSIKRLEETPRELYTGAIGVVEPDQQATFAVAIRTAWQAAGEPAAEYGVGNGIVADSQVDEEYAELLSKTRLLTSQSREFAVLETMRLARGEVALLARHLERAQFTCLHFGFPWRQDRVEAALAQAAQTHPTGLWRVRLLCDRLGNATAECLPLSRDTDKADPTVSVCVAHKAIDAHSEFVRFKTTHRRLYEEFQHHFEHHEPLLFNAREQVTESPIANIVYQQQGRLFTPPVSDGLLPGTLRGELLERGIIAEQSLHLTDLPGVERLWLVNALRGWRAARLDTHPDSYKPRNASRMSRG